MLHLTFGMAVTPVSPGGKARSGVDAVLTVRMVGEPAAPPLPGPTPTVDRASRPAKAETRARPAEGAPALALPQVPDTTYYGARDLDVYPRPVATLDFQRLADRAATRPTTELRLELLIDEHGIVNEVSFAEPRESFPMEERVRAVLASARFHPARMGGRPVKSRVLLSISFAPAGSTVSH